jgi:hypothetical protein
VAWRTTPSKTFASKTPKSHSHVLLGGIVVCWLSFAPPDLVSDENIYLPCIGWILLDTAVIVGVVIYG